MGLTELGLGLFGVAGEAEKVYGLEEGLGVALRELRLLGKGEFWGFAHVIIIMLGLMSYYMYFGEFRDLICVII
jgi:hypothetical protein